MTDIRCAACGAWDMDLFHEQPSVPANSCLLLPDPRQAREFPRGALRLAFCTRCGFISNVAFDSSLAEYSSRYEETQGFSGRFRDFARNLAKRWVDTYDLRGRSVLEIGCGKGEFLTMMCEEGVEHGVGIDPGVDPTRIDPEMGERITWIADFYSDGYAHLQADAIVCRHTLEHLWPVGDSMRMIRRNIGERLDTIVLFELPDALRVLREVAFWDVYYEHCSYFSAGSLTRLFRTCGFEVLELGLDYEDQYLLIAARPVEETPAPQPPRPLALEDDLDALREAVDNYRRTYQDKVASLHADVEQVRRYGGRVVIWGAGSKGVSYLNTLGISDEVEYAVDINPFKHGMYIAGTGQQIVAPEFLRDYQPDLVIAMNPIYLEEIRRDLDGLGVPADLMAV